MNAVQVVCRDVAYDLIPVMQRRSLHAKLAEVLAAAPATSAVPPATVAYHWAQACKSLSSSMADFDETPKILKVVRDKLAANKIDKGMEHVTIRSI